MKKMYLIAVAAAVIAISGCGGQQTAVNSPAPTPDPAQTTSTPFTTATGLKLDFEKLYPQADIREYAKKFIGSKAPDFTLKNMKGQDVSLSSFKGKNVVLEIGESTCQYCQKVQPELDKFRQANTDITVLQLFSLDRKENVNGFLSATGSKEHDGFLTGETGNTVNRDYQNKYTPTFFFVNGDGIIQFVHVGEVTNVLLQSMASLSFPNEAVLSGAGGNPGTETPTK